MASFSSVIFYNVFYILVDAQRIVQEWVYELPHDVYDTQGLFDVEDEGKQEDQGLLEDV